MWRFGLLLSMSACCVGVMAQDVSQLYATSQLEEIGNRYRPNLIGMWDEDFQSRLTSDERLRAGVVTLNLPLMGPAHNPLEFYSSPAQRQVFLPIASVKFIDDLAVAFAYYEKNGCNVGIVSDYAAVLRYRPQDVSGTPLDVLGVPRGATNDRFVDDVSQKVLKSIVFFAAAHEYAHVMYRHKGYNTITAAQAQQQETQADAFALDVMRRIGVAPVALVNFFLIDSRLEVSPGDFPSLAAYENYLRHTATHPLSTRRILDIADGIQGHLDEFARLQADPPSARRKLEGMVSELRTIAVGLDDREMRRFLAEQARSANPATFRVACQH